MTTEMRKTGIDVVGDMVAWGAHFCLFYETKEDLLDSLIAYCKSGLGREEYCLWIVAEPLTIEAATAWLCCALTRLRRVELLKSWMWCVHTSLSSQGDTGIGTLSKPPRSSEPRPKSRGSMRNSNNVS